MKQSWKPASQDIRECTYKRTKGTSSLKQVNTAKKGICFLNKDSKTSKLNKISKQAPKAEDRTQQATARNQAVEHAETSKTSSNP